MTVLTVTKTWRRPVRTNRTPDLTAEEQANVRLAIKFLRVRFGGSVKLAAALKVGHQVIDKACMARGRPSAALTLRASRLAKQPIEALLEGTWPGTACPHCGRQ